MRTKKPKPLHERLHALIQQKSRAKEVTQESLAAAIGKDQTTVGLYIRGDKAGPLDLDEAADALKHIGSSLQEFLAGVPPADLTASERLARDLEQKPEIVAFVEDLLRVPKPRLAQALPLLRETVYLAIGRRAIKTGAFPRGTSVAERTTRGPTKRR